MRGFIIFGALATLARGAERSTQQRNMRGFIIFGALATLARGAELPATAGAAVRTNYYIYDSTQSEAPDSNIPTAWTGTCTTGSAQSPIDIVSTSAVVETVDPGAIELTGYDIDLTGTLVNDGRQITFTPTSPAFKPSIYGGALASSTNYVFDHLEFKFGLDSTSGSEHTMDGTKSPMEIQLVHYEAKYADGATAGVVSTAGTVVVLSFLVDATATTANTALASVITAIGTPANFKPAAPGTAGTDVGAAAQDTAVTLNLKSLIGDLDEIVEYYYYAGSQTVQPCTENVKWIIPTNKITMTETNRAKFSDLFAEDAAAKKVAPNNRPVQTNTISVMMREDTSTKKSNVYKEAATILGSTLLGIGTFGTVLNILNNDATSKALKSNPILDLIEDFDEKFLGGDEQQPAQQQFQPQQFQQRY